MSGPELQMVGVLRLHVVGVERDGTTCLVGAANPETLDRVLRSSFGCTLNRQESCYAVVVGPGALAGTAPTIEAPTETPATMEGDAK